MTERLIHVPQALVVQFTYDDESLSHVVRADQFSLTPGNGVYFMRDDNQNVVPIQFRQLELNAIYSKIDFQRLQLLAVLEQKTGSLFMTDGSEERTYAIDETVRSGSRFAEFNLGRFQIAGIWGQSSDEVGKTLAQLQGGRVGLN